MPTQPQTADLLAQANLLHRQGRFTDAEGLYLQVLGSAPDHFEAQHFLSILRRQQRRTAEALALARAALQLRPDSTEALCNLGLVLTELKRFDDALEAFNKATTIKSDYVDPLIGQANVLQILNRAEEALASYDRAVELRAEVPEIHFNRGIILHQLGRHENALRSFDKAIALSPRDAESYYNRGVVLLGLGRIDDALESFTKATDINPTLAQAQYSRGNLLAQRGEFQMALAAYNAAISSQQHYIDALNNRGNVLLELRQVFEALGDFDRAISLRPDYAQAHCNRGNALAQLQRYDDALESYNRAIELNPSYAEAYYNRGNAFAEAGRLRLAQEAYETAIAIKPDYAAAYCNLGNTLLELNEPHLAIDNYDNALALKPDYTTAGSNKIFAADFIPEFEFAAHQELRKIWDKTHASTVPKYDNYRNNPDPCRKLVIGYVSADFKQNSPAAAFGPLLRNHDRAEFDIVCYSNAAVDDSLTSEFRRLAHKWHSIYGLSDEIVADVIRQDGIDILVDLSGHTRGNRLLLFARRPAPIGVTLHAINAGLSAIDYIFSDKIVVPTAIRPLFAETVYDLPCCLNYEAPAYVPAVSELPAATNGYITFGCLNRFYKVSARVLELWAQILLRVPYSRLLLKDRLLDDETMCKVTRSTLVDHGVSGDRIEIRGTTPHREHLFTYNEVDIALDPFPMNGGITTWEALTMGVPVAAKLGNSYSSRASASILHALNLDDWIAERDANYIAMVVDKARNMPALAEFRRTIRSVIQRSIVGDPVSYTRALESAYKDVWKVWCGSITSESI